MLSAGRNEPNSPSDVSSANSGLLQERLFSCKSQVFITKARTNTDLDTPEIRFCHVWFEIGIQMRAELQ